MLTLVGDKVLPVGIKDGILALCPTMDLIALANKENQVQVHRINGEIVFSVPRKRPEANVMCLQWKPNGRLLVIGYDDSTRLQINTHTGLVVNKTQIGNDSSPVSYVGWGLNLSDPKGTSRRVSKGDKNATLDHLLNQGFEDSSIAVPPDLPYELALLDIEVFLPKLSPLPALNREEDLFSTRASLDSLFHEHKKEDQESTDVLLTSYKNGSVHVGIYDIFQLGSFVRSHPYMDLVGYSSHPYSSTHALVWQAIGSTERTYFQALDLPQMTDTGRYLPLIASKTTQMQNLLRYINLAIQQIVSEFKSSQDLPRKFIRNIEEALQESEHCRFVDGAYHLAATGHCYAAMKEWLIDELGDRGHKRWEKAAVSGYEKVRQYTHEHLLPGLQRISILMNRLRGLSRFQDSSIALGLATQEFDQIFVTLGCLQLAAHCVLIFSNNELQQFHAFSAWMKYEIDIQGVDLMSTSADEQLERDPMLDSGKILDYIEGPMLSSRLYELLDLETDDNRESWDLRKEGSVLYERYKRAISRFKDGERLDRKLPGLQILLSLLQQQCEAMFKKISEAQGRKIRLDSLLELTFNNSQSDVIMLPQDDWAESQRVTVYIAQTNKQSPHQATICSIGLLIMNGISSVVRRSAATIRFPEGCKIQDIKFADSQKMIVVLGRSVETRILYVKYREESTQEMEGLRYKTTSGPIEMGTIVECKIAAVIEDLTKLTFPSKEHPWQPDRVQVNGRQGRRLLCAIASDRGRYALFDLDTGRQDEEQEEDEDSDE